jgi:hypothetical protein
MIHKLLKLAQVGTALTNKKLRLAGSTFSINKLAIVGGGEELRMMLELSLFDDEEQAKPPCDCTACTYARNVNPEVFPTVFKLITEGRHKSLVLDSSYRAESGEFHAKIRVRTSNQGFVGHGDSMLAAVAIAVTHYTASATQS